MVAIDERLAAQAGELADRLGLRGYDAVHLAIAPYVSLNARSGPSPPPPAVLEAWARWVAYPRRVAGSDPVGPDQMRWSEPLRVAR
jgi:hypothetical protein